MPPPDFVFARSDFVLVSQPQEQRLVLMVTGNKFDELHRAINRAINTDESAQSWLLELADAMETDPIPQPQERKA